LVISKSGFDISMAGELPAVPASQDSCSAPHGGPSAAQLMQGYFARANAHAEPVGSRFFFTNTSGTIFQKPFSGGPFADTNITGPPATGLPLQ